MSAPGCSSNLSIAPIGGAADDSTAPDAYGVILSIEMSPKAQALIALYGLAIAAFHDEAERPLSPEQAGIVGEAAAAEEAIKIRRAYQDHAMVSRAKNRLVS